MENTEPVQVEKTVIVMGSGFESSINAQVNEREASKEEVKQKK